MVVRDIRDVFENQQADFAVKDERQLTIEAVIGDSKQLSAAEQQRMAVYEAAVEAAFAGQTAGTLAAEQINHEKLWRQDYASFDDYCELKWRCSQEQMYRRIRAARVVSNLTEGKAKLSPSMSNLTEMALPNVSQAVELAKLDNREDQREVWQVVNADEGPVTARKVEEAVKKHQAVAAEPLKERAFALAAQLQAERDTARALVMMQGLPTDRAIAILERLLELGTEVSTGLLRQWRSDDEREKKAAFAVMQGKHPPADPRRLILESLMEEMTHCRDLFPDDVLIPEFNRLVEKAEALIAALREQ